MKPLRTFSSLFIATVVCTTAFAPSFDAFAASVTAKTAPVYNPVVTQAMQYVKKRSDIPLMAPLFAGNGNGARGKAYLAATAFATANQYHVSLQLSKTPVGLNSPVLDQPPNTGLAGLIGGFGATEFNTAAKALQQVEVTPQSVNAHGYGYLNPEAQHLASSRVNLGLGIWSSVYTGRNIALIDWREGEWFFQVQDTRMIFAKGTAMQLVRYLHTHLLPETHGLMTVIDAGDGQHTNLSYAVGNVVYNVWDYHHALSAARMAVSMTPYHGAPEAVFKASISRALTSLQQTPTINLPLFAPTDFLMTASEMSAIQVQTQVQKNQYTITLSPSGSKRGDTNPIASFGVQRFTGNPTALQFIKQMSAPPNFAGMTSRAVSLGNGIVGKIYSDLGIVRWHEGLWTFDVEAGSASSDLALAKRMVAYLHTHLLPETHGYMGVKNTPAGHFSHLYWAFGRDVYNVYSVRHAFQAFHMAVSSATY
ncbi:hypothetical protein [Ferroacidibacillus organovorans]|uniref:Beta-lactamase-related domain-containing protein n=1 Tax=Ferroacidibacillus organovorans TaxID=1765683 RepID=A0A101XTI5_9BACL|nr:hypothetical protein [Ferroacidibacillus organovorans]KUO97312.1 hypothetical protein ATW55_04510 [Ferroacidibacillus organovorans]